MAKSVRFAPEVPFPTESRIQHTDLGTVFGARGGVGAQMQPAMMRAARILGRSAILHETHVESVFACHPPRLAPHDICLFALGAIDTVWTFDGMGNTTVTALFGDTTAARECHSRLVGATKHTP